MGLFSSITAKFADVGAAYTKFNDKEAGEGVVAMMVGTSNADGEFEPAEKAKFVKALEVNPILKQFDKSVLLTKARELQDQFDFDTDMGIDACLKELREASKGASEEKRIAIARMGVAAAKADGEVEPAELAFLTKACAALNLTPSQVGL
jgi:tellurite resistance protein